MSDLTLCIGIGLHLGVVLYRYRDTLVIRIPTTTVPAASFGVFDVIILLDLVVILLMVAYY